MGVSTGSQESKPYFFKDSRTYFDRSQSSWGGVDAAKIISRAYICTQNNTLPSYRETRLLGDGASWSTVVEEGDPVDTTVTGATTSIIRHDFRAEESTLGSGYQQKDRKPSQNDKTEHGMEKTVQNQGQSPKNAKVRVNTEESAVKPEPELKNTIRCNLNPSDGPGKPNSIIMKTVKTKWALNQLQQPICVHLTKTVKTLKAQS
ncbi:hypothetical protein Tco_1494051 [Tanacetum coccineum]